MIPFNDYLEMVYNTVEGQHTGIHRVKVRHFTAGPLSVGRCSFAANTTNIDRQLPSENARWVGTET